MKRWIAGLTAALVLPACGDGSKGSPSTDATTAGVGAGRQPTVRIVSPESGTTAPEGSTIKIHAVADSDVEIDRVEFYDDNRLIGSKSSPPWIISYGRLKARAHLLCAVAVYFDGSTAASPPVTLFVVKGDDDDDRKD